MLIKKIIKNLGEFVKGVYRKEIWHQILLKKMKKIFKIKEKERKMHA